MSSNDFDYASYKELAFFPLLGQSSIYNLSDLPSQSSISSSESLQHAKYDIMAASLLPAVETSSSSRCCNLYSFASDGDKLISVKESFDFTYLPAADIVCIDAFFDCHTKHYLLCMGLVKEDGTSFFNIYAAENLCELPERCICLSELPFFPLKATHTCYISPTTKSLQWAFLLSCSGSLPPPYDLASSSIGPIQVYSRLLDAGFNEAVESSGPVEDKPSEVCPLPPLRASNEGSQSRKSVVTAINKFFGSIGDSATRALFPELDAVPLLVITYMDFVILDGESPLRLSAFGSLDGWIGVGLVDMTVCELKAFYSTRHDSAITQLKFFQQSSVNVSGAASFEGVDDFSLLVCSGLEPTVIYRFPFRNRELSPTNQLLLPRSADFDHVNCACVGDLDFDGQPEIVVGTFGQQLLFYQWRVASGDEDDDGHYELAHRRQMVGPVHGVRFGRDYLGDGSKCLSVLTSHGVHLFQCDLDFCVNLLNLRLDVSASKAIRIY